jgi:tripartite-type tricarboxylate transporter receptor subunit TctC
MHRIFMLAAVALGCTAAAAQYPARPVTLIAPYSVGGNSDLAARAFAAVAPKYLGQPVVVVNRTGAGGTVGSQAVLDSPPDGYTLLLARVGSQAVAPALDPATPYKWDAFTMLSLLEVEPYICVVSGKSPHKSFRDLLAAIKAQPGKLSYASTGNTDASVVFPVKAFLNLGLSADAALKVPYKGAGDTVGAVLGGHVDFACNGMNPYVGPMKSGDLRGLVVSTRTRVPESPDTPTAEEVGMPDLEVVSGWSALYGPPALPKDVVARWANVLSQIKSDPEWLALVKKRGAVPSIMTPEETKSYVEAQYNAYRALAPHFGAKK